MTDVLILGGTGWLSGRIAERWMDAGASVTCLARGTRPVPYGARLVVADRDEPEAYDAVRGRDWDEVVEVSSRSTHVAAAAAALAGDTRHLTYVSSVSVYAANNEEGADEGASLVEPAALGDDGDDARAKAACEAAVRAALPHRAAIVRPGLIGGPGDPTDRFGYWVSRFALAEGGAVLVPDAPVVRVQVIDVDDLAAFVAALGAAGFSGTVNAVGDPSPLPAVLAAAHEVSGNRVSVAGFDGIQLGEYVHPALTTVRTSPRQIGYEAARVLLATIESGAAEDPAVGPAGLVLRLDPSGVSRSPLALAALALEHPTPAGPEAAPGQPVAAAARRQWCGAAMAARRPVRCPLRPARPSRTRSRRPATRRPLPRPVRGPAPRPFPRDASSRPSCPPLRMSSVPNGRMRVRDPMTGGRPPLVTGGH